jgi:hypothetical protein
MGIRNLTSICHRDGSLNGSKSRVPVKSDLYDVALVVSTGVDDLPRSHGWHSTLDGARLTRGVGRRKNSMQIATVRHALTGVGGSNDQGSGALPGLPAPFRSHRAMFYPKFRTMRSGIHRLRLSFAVPAIYGQADPSGRSAMFASTNGDLHVEFGAEREQFVGDDLPQPTFDVRR